MAAYALCVTDGDTIKSQRVISEDTLVGYLNAAALWLQLHFQIQTPMYQGSGKSKQLHPFLAEIVRQRRTWRRPQEKKEPISQEILEWMRSAVAQAIAAHDSHSLDLLASVFDWISLAVFTGSRVSEYAQSKIPKGCRFATIPNVSEAGLWAGQPFAFVEADFTFYDKNRRRVTFEIALSGAAEEIHIRFRYDKSKENFTIRKFRRMHGCFLCPVKSGLSIVQRARRLRVPPDEPLGIFRRDSSGAYAFLKSTHIVSILRRACVQAHPDPQHYLRIHVKRLVSHSNRVTAAVALYNAGVPVEDISFRLRWNSDAVKFYLRDCYRTIGHLTERALVGALMVE